MEVIIIKNELIDAVKTAKSIHDGDYSSLLGNFFVIRGKIKKKNNHHPGDNTVKKPTLSQRLDELTEIVKDGFKRVNTRIDNLEKDVSSLKQDVKDINTRIDRIDTRLDYIVKANNLKDSK
ncbi:MAG: hypothetical protein MJ199_01125 [Bacilli bacterium]|nr:hypothetical protein [Bacilli bacterium]